MSSHKVEIQANVDLSMPAGKFKGFALVRDKDGNPKVDDPDNLPPEIYNALTDKDKEYLYGTNSRNNT